MQKRHLLEADRPKTIYTVSKDYNEKDLSSMFYP